MKKIGLFYGGMGSEAEVSLLSALNIQEHLNQDLYTLVPIFWSPEGKFFQASSVADYHQGKEIALEEFSQIFDIAFPITHWKYGEDGILQALFESQKIPYCGCWVLSSAICMDKGVFKLLCQGQHLPQVPFALLSGDFPTDEQLVEDLLKNYGVPLFIKPANSGSSLGITKIDKLEDFKQAYELALHYDKKILLEKGLVHPKEIEVWIVGNDRLIISEPWELVLEKDFYDYDDKYLKGESSVRIPAEISYEQKREIQNYAQQVYQLCGCRGFARVDFFLTDEGIFLNEINTLPWFTNISMFPMLMQASGMSYQDLLSSIIELA